MIEHVWTVLCTRVLIDRASNNATLVEVIERLAGPATDDSEPGLIAIPMDLITLWTRSDLEKGERGRARMRLLAPDGSQLGGSVPYDVDLTAGHRLRNTTRLGALPFKGAGYHRFVIELEDADGKWQPVARVPLDVRLDIPVTESPQAADASAERQAG